MCSANCSCFWKRWIKSWRFGFWCFWVKWPGYLRASQTCYCSVSEDLWRFLQICVGTSDLWWFLQICETSSRCFKLCCRIYVFWQTASRMLLKRALLLANSNAFFLWHWETCCRSSLNCANALLPHVGGCVSQSLELCSIFKLFLVVVVNDMVLSLFIFLYTFRLQFSKSDLEENNLRL